MGCDIWCYIEKYNSESKRWENLSLYKLNDDGTGYEPVQFYDYRNYMLFGILAGVRFMTNPISYPRGIPDDLSDYVGSVYSQMKESIHTPTWYDFCELAMCLKVMSESEQLTKRQAMEIDSLNREIKRLRGEGDDCIDEECVEDDEYTEAEALEGFVDSARKVLESYNIYNPSPGQIRIVMWFDS